MSIPTSPSEPTSVGNSNSLPSRLSLADPMHHSDEQEQAGPIHAAAVTKANLSGRARYPDPQAEFIARRGKETIAGEGGSNGNCPRGVGESAGPFEHSDQDQGAP